MNLDDLKTEWAARDRQLEKSIRLNTWLMRDTWLQQGRAEIRKLGPFALAELLMWLPSLALLGAFMALQVDQPKFFFAALPLFVWSLVMPLWSIHTRAQLRRLDFGEPVIVLQRKLEQQRIARLRAFQWAFMVGQVIWYVPFLIVFFKGVFGVDLYASPGPAVLVRIGLVSFVGVTLILLLFTRLARHFRHTAFIRKIADSLTGRDMAAARAFLTRLEQLEREAEATP